MGRILTQVETVAYDSLTVSNLAKRLTLTKIRGSTTQPRAEGVLITVEGDQIRWRDDGTDPTDTEGHLANPGSTIELDGRNRVEKFRAIRVTTDATLRVSYLA